MSIFQTFSTPADYEAGSGAAPVADPWRVPRRGVPWRWLATAIVPLALVYLSMLNRYWVPSGDGEVYTCIARALVKGEGLMFNGQRAAIAPPGWPLVLSWAMRVSPEFLFLKLVTTASMLGALVVAFFICRRFVSDRAAAATILLTGTLSTLYPLTYWMHTEAFFCLLGFGAILIAFRIAERRALPVVETPLLLFLLAFGAFTRWPGVLHIVLVVPILLSGGRRPWARPSRWLTVALVCAVSVGTFRGTYRYLQPTAAEKAAYAKANTAPESEGDSEQPIEPEMPLPTTGPITTTAPTTTQPALTNDAQTPGWADVGGRDAKRGPVGEFLNRISIAGRWFAWLLWQPTRFGQSVRAIDAAAMAFGWLSILLLAATMFGGLARRNFFWVGLAAYTGGLCVLWPNPNARYFVPVAPFILAGVLLGIAQLNAWVDARLWHRRALADDPHNPPAEPGIVEPSDPQTGALRLVGGWKLLALVFVVATLASNLPLLAVDISIFRSSDFYGRYEAGSNKDLIAAAQFIRENPRGPICVSERYENLGRARWSKYGVRALHLLTDRPILPMQHKAKMAVRPTDDNVRKWLNKGVNDVDYYVYQTEWKPWRVWHFQLSPELQQKLTGRPAFNAGRSGGWELWGRKNASYRPIPIDPKDFEPPTRVPGL